MKQQPFQLLSKNCQGGDCELLRRIRKAKDEVFEDRGPSEIGNPGFRLCAKLGGNAKVIKVKDKGRVINFNECRFEQDKSFASVDFLLYEARFDRPWL